MPVDSIITLLLTAVLPAAALSSHPSWVMGAGIAAALLLRWLLNRWKG